MQAPRIAELLDPFLGPPDARRLASDAFDHISTYIDLLQRWNARINLTAIRNEEEIVTRHFGESLFAAMHLFPARISISAPQSHAAATEPAAEQRKNTAHGASRGSDPENKAQAPEGRKKGHSTDLPEADTQKPD